MSNSIEMLRIRSLQESAVQKKRRAHPEGEFQKVLNQSIRKNQGVTFSKHACERIQERKIDLSQDELGRIEEALDIAADKGLKTPVIVTENFVYIANVSSRTIVTAMDSMKGKVFTNVDGVVNR